MSNYDYLKDWKHALRCGFGHPQKTGDGIQHLAPFAVHSNDAMHAERMIELCKRDGISNNEVLEYAEEFLTELGCSAEKITEEIERVDRFIGIRLD